MNIAALMKRLVSPTNIIPPGFDPDAYMYKSYGKYAFAQGKEILSTGQGLCIGGGYSGKAYLKKGTLVGLNLTYISKMWNIWNPETLDTFYDEIYPYAHKGHLKPLMGICIPTVIGAYATTAGRITLAMEPPHHIGWHEADPYASLELKDKIVEAYRKIHAQGVLHNDVELRHMLIGDDEKVTIIDFGIASTKATPPEYALEMRKVKYVIDYKGAKAVEYARMRNAEARHARNLERARLRSIAATQEEIDLIEADEPPSDEEIDYPPFAIPFLMEWDSEVATAGRPGGSGWRGKRFEIPPELRTGPFKGDDSYERLPLQPYQEVNFGQCAREAIGSEPFVNHQQWMEHCRYSTWLWSTPQPVESDQFNPNHPAALPSVTFQRAEPEIPAVVVPSVSSPRKRSREVEDGEIAAPSRKKLARAPSKITSLPGKRPRPVEGDAAEAPPRKKQQSVELRTVAKTRANRAWEADSNLSDPVPVLTHDFVSETEESVKSPASNSHSLPTLTGQCSIILVDKDAKQNVWTVTKRMMEDIQGYLRVKAKRVYRKEPDGYDASGSERASSNSSRKRKASVDGAEPDMKRSRKSQ